MSCLVGFYLNASKCYLVPSYAQNFQSILCDSKSTAFRIFDGTLHKLQKSVDDAFEASEVSVHTLKKIAGKDMSMKIVVRLASVFIEIKHDANPGPLPVTWHLIVAYRRNLLSGVT